MPLYAAYGSNMDPAQMKERAPHSPMAGTGWLMGWRLTFGGEDFAWEGALSTVVEDPLSQVFVVLYDVPDHDAAQLDRWEGGELGLHKKLRLRVHTLDGDVLAAATVFPKDRSLDTSVGISTLDRPRILEYEARGWRGY